MCNPRMNKEPCGICSKPLKIGNILVECEFCDSIVHSDCYSTSEFALINDKWACKNCEPKIVPRYNPFKNWTEQDSKHYDSDCGGDMTKLSNILDKCKPYTILELNNMLPNIIPTDSNLFSILSSFFLNIDGNFTNFDTLQVILKSISHSFSVIGLAETNIGPNECDPYIIPGYQSFYQNKREGKKSGTGVALYINESLNGNIIEELSECSTDIESIIVKISNLDRPIYFGAVYRPHDSDISSFYNKLNKIFESLPKHQTFIMGDYNIDLLNKKLDQDYEEIIITNSYSPVISTYTHDKPGCRKSCIDNILTNCSDDIILTGTLTDNINHHLPIFQFSDITTPAQNSKTKHTQYFEYSNKNLSGLVNDLEHEIKQLSPSTDFSKFTTLFESLLEKNCKLEKPKVTKRTVSNNPWITESIINSVEKKHELKKAWIKSKTKKCKLGDPILREKFTSYQKVLRATIKQAKKSHTHSRFTDCKEDRKKTWNIINELRGKNKHKLKPLFTINNQKVTNRRVIANKFNSYFISIASKLNSEISDTPIANQSLPSFQDFLNPTNNRSFVIYDCDESEILGIISELVSGKASDIPIKIIKRAAHVISPILSKYYNILMHAGIFPDVLKVGKITPVFKKGDSELLENYRPISTLPIFGKIFEKVIYTRLYSFFTSQNLLYDKQFGFRKSHSTGHALNHSVTHIINQTLQKNFVLGIFIDLSKAFDTIDHDSLIVKLDRYGVRGSANDLLKSYLSNRRQYTECFDVKSDTLKVEYGVPQGSVLGPLLFLIYINDIVNCSPHAGEFILFADDTNIFVSARSIDEAYKSANTVLESLTQYMITNKLHINMTKCSYILFKPKCKLNDEPSSDLHLIINNTVIKRVTHAKFLGVIIDEKLSWDQHIKDLKRKLYYALSTINRIKQNIPEHLYKDLYYTLFESNLTYCLPVWGGVSQSQLDKVHKVQKKMLRILFGDVEAFKDKFKTCARARATDDQRLGTTFYEKEHTKPIFEKHKILTIHNLYTYSCFIDTFKILKLQMPTCLYYEYQFSTRKYLTYTKVIPPLPSNSFIYRSSIIWNDIRQKLNLTDMTTPSCKVKTQLKSLLHTNQHRHDNLHWLPTHDYKL